VVQTGTLESLLTGVEYASALATARSGHNIAVRDQNEFVCR
jgi:hypothetical protein